MAESGRGGGREVKDLQTLLASLENLLEIRKTSVDADWCTEYHLTQQINTSVPSSQYNIVLNTITLPMVDSIAGRMLSVIERQTKKL